MRILNHNFSAVTGRYCGEPTRFNTNYTNIRMEFNSTFRERIFWKDSRGIVALEPQEWGTGPEAFHITIEYEVPTHTRLDVNAMLNDINLVDSPTLKKEIINSAIHVENTPCHTAIRKFRVTVKVSKEELDRANGVVYLQEYDLIIGYERLKDISLHPYSQPGMIEEMRRSMRFNHEGVNLRMVLIDNRGQADPVWYNNGLKVVKLSPTRNTNLRDGLYVFVKEEGEIETMEMFIPLENVNKQAMFFLSRTDAENHGKPDKVIERLKMDFEASQLVQKREIAELEARLRREKNEMEHEQLEYKRKRELEDREFTLRNERMRSALQHEREALELRIREFEAREKADKEKRELEFELKSRKQKFFGETAKNTMEILKGILAVASTAFMLYATIKGISLPKK